MIAEAPVIETGAWTYESIANIADEKRREIYLGNVYEIPSPSILHQLVYRALLRILERWIDTGGRGILFYQPVDLVLSNEAVFVSDLAYCETNKVGSVVSESGTYLISSPDLIVELISPSTEAHDRATKYRAYAEFGVRHYWIVDCEARTLHALVLQGDHYVDEAVLKSGEEFQPRLFPGTVLALDSLFPSS
jgi:Uma2 family endonuclease